jgi:predicted transcriptional regulator of viral defense system
MSIKEYLNFFQTNRDLQIFHLNDMETILKKKEKVARVEVSRLTTSNIITKIGKGYYANPFNPPSIELIAMYLKKPSYISLEKALSMHSILSQSVFTFTCVTLDLTQNFSYKEITFEYSHIASSYFFGFKKTDQNFYIADPEKALLDFIYFRHFKTSKENRYSVYSLLEDMNLETINQNKFYRYVSRMNLNNHILKCFPDLFA